jgi:hypothetical protein
MEGKMKKDILEQLVEDYYVSRQGWFVKHNIKYRPSKTHPGYIRNKDSSFSDIDIMAINGTIKGTKPDRVHVISCKSWQDGFGINNWLDVLEETVTSKGNARWQKFRELISDIWIDSFLDTIERETGQINFTYIIAVTKIKEKRDEKKDIEDCKIIINKFKKRKSDIKIKFLTLEDIIQTMKERIEKSETNSTESTDTGRIIQLFLSAKILEANGEQGKKSNDQKTMSKAKRTKKKGVTQR